MDTSLEVDLGGCWHHHEIAENDKSDSDIILIDSIHSQYDTEDTDTDVSDEEGMQISSHQNLVMSKLASLTITHGQPSYLFALTL